MAGYLQPGVTGDGETAVPLEEVTGVRRWYGGWMGDAGTTGVAVAARHRRLSWWCHRHERQRSILPGGLPGEREGRRSASFYEVPWRHSLVRNSIPYIRVFNGSQIKLQLTYRFMLKRLHFNGLRVRMQIGFSFFKISGECCREFSGPCRVWPTGCRHTSTYRWGKPAGA